mmetsp:Transcript_50815/g.99369  ORF Transcript_50815/g.99369 Transcript_50815/m.99369 type:complete len:721 (+) Transcript_50815:121-2283(+)
MKSRKLAVTRCRLTGKKCNSQWNFFSPVHILSISAALLRNKSLALVQDGNKQCNEGSEQCDITTQKSEKGARTYPCGMYLAESSIPNSGIGLYAGVPYSKDQQIASRDVAVPVIDRIFHHDGPDADDLDFDERKLDWILVDYFWQAASCLPANFETYTDTVDCVVPSLGMAANSHQGLKNSGYDRSKVGSAGLSRYRDPGAGAITNYHVEFTTNKALEAGSELFVDYGENWFIEREEELGFAPLENDFAWGDKMLKKIQKSGVFDLKTQSADIDEYYKLLKDIVFSIDKKKANSLPEEVSDFDHAAEKGSAASSTPNYIRSIEWLEDHGTCVDTVDERLSTVPGAGWGAFLKRPVKKGEVIIVSPLIHFPFDDVMNMYENVFSDGKEMPSIDGTTADFYSGKETHSTRTKGQKIASRQLLINYLFGNPKSTMLFFPYVGSIGLINHGAEGEVNVQVQWPSDHSAPNGPGIKYHKQSWLDLTVDQLSDESKGNRGLMMEIVATRDIEVDEEIFLDYGPAWQKAWDDHVKEWKPWTTNLQYVPSFSMNTSLEEVRTEDELIKNPYPGPNIATACFLNIGNAENLKEIKDEDDDDWDDEDDPPKRIFQWFHPNSSSAKKLLESENLHPCTIIDRYIINDKEFFSAIIVTNPNNPPNEEREDDEAFLDDVANSRVKLEVRNIPREGVTFIDKAYSGDIHLPGTFRFPIAIPDGIFPEKWKNISK